MENWIEIFKGGENTDSTGKKRNWSSQDLDNIVKNFNPSGDTVPVVIGHPADDASSPAYGWVGAVRRIGDTLQAKLRNLYPQFIEGVKAKLWPNRSVRLVKSDNGWALGHIGFLGASPPAIDGMTPVFQKYAEYCDFHCPNWQYKIGGKMTEEDLRGKMTKEDLKRIVEEILNANFSNSKKTPEVAHVKADNNIAELVVASEDSDYQKLFQQNQQLLQQNQQFRQQLEIIESRYNQEKNQLWVETQVKSGRLLPSQVDGLSDFLTNLQRNKLVVNFSATGKPPVPMELFFMKFVENMPKHGLFQQTEYTNQGVDVSATGYDKIIEKRFGKGG